MADRLEMFGPTREFSGMADSIKPCKMLWADPCCHGNEIWARLRDPVAYRFVFSVCCSWNAWHSLKLCAGELDRWLGDKRRSWIHWDWWLTWSSRGKLWAGWDVGLANVDARDWAQVSVDSITCECVASALTSVVFNILQLAMGVVIFWFLCSHLLQKILSCWNSQQFHFPLHGMVLWLTLTALHWITCISRASYTLSEWILYGRQTLLNIPSSASATILVLMSFKGTASENLVHISVLVSTSVPIWWWTYWSSYIKLLGVNPRYRAPIGHLVDSAFYPPWDGKMSISFRGLSDNNEWQWWL